MIFEAGYQKIKATIQYALDHGSFNKRNIVDNAKHVCIYGTGRFFEDAFDQLFLKHGIRVDFLCDRNPEKWGKTIQGLPCISPERLTSIENIVVIPMIGKSKEVEDMLDKIEVPYVNPFALGLDVIADLPRDINWFRLQAEKIFRVHDMLNDLESKRVYAEIITNRLGSACRTSTFTSAFSGGEYFKPGVYSLSHTESFVDCGAYNGDSIRGFLSATNDRFANIYSLELDSDNYKQLGIYVGSLNEEIADKIRIFNNGVWDEETIINYGKEEKGSCESYGPLKAENYLLPSLAIKTCKTIKLDNLLKEKEVTLLKMDVEGCEQRALKGATNIIAKQKPKLAVCIYHKIDDLWEVPLFMKQNVPEYKLAVRHHGVDRIEGTVCYAF